MIGLLAFGVLSVLLMSYSYLQPGVYVIMLFTKTKIVDKPTLAANSSDLNIVVSFEAYPDILFCKVVVLCMFVLYIKFIDVNKS